MVVLRKLDIETDEIRIKINENHQKGVACVDFVATLIQDFSISNIDFTYETDQLHSHS